MSPVSPPYLRVARRPSWRMLCIAPATYKELPVHPLRLQVHARARSTQRDLPRSHAGVTLGWRVHGAGTWCREALGRWWTIPTFAPFRSRRRTVRRGAAGFTRYTQRAPSPSHIHHLHPVGGEEGLRFARYTRGPLQGGERPAPSSPPLYGCKNANRTRVNSTALNELPRIAVGGQVPPPGSPTPTQPKNPMI